jgi:predicted nuclease of restriction endonuclease-like RecB superfamily
MLTSDLLVTRVHNGKIEPVYALPDQENLEIASSVIGIFHGHVGRTYGELIEEVRGFEEINYRFIRGMAQILERRCVIDKDSAIDPVIARRAVFEESGGFITCDDEREAALDKASRKLSVEPDDLEKALFADQEENLIVKEFQTITQEDLLKEYNLSMAQTLLFKATGMEIRIENNYQQVFRKIKQFGLMYTILDGKIYLDGPVSLFKLTEKYGTAFAKLLPTIIASNRWSLKASILKKTSQGKRIYDFTLDYTKKGIFGMKIGLKERVGFDSAIEKEFYQLSFNGWAVRREPTVLKAGQYAFIPDFSLERNGTKVYVEIIGFWTPEYLKNKIQKINLLRETESIILLVDRKLGCSGSEFKTDNLIFYDRKIPHLEIIKILRKYEEKQLIGEVTKLRNIEISLDGSASIISLDEMARRYGVSLEALKESIKGRNNAAYSLLGDQLVSNQILKTIQGELSGVRKHDDALEIFKRYGIKAHSQALKFLGFKVKWTGLNPEDAEILKAYRRAI